MRPAPLCRRAAWLVVACVLALARLASAEAAPVDLDGDGQHDRWTVERSDPSAVHVWLSQTQSTHVIRTHVPVVQVVAVDLDGDRRPELVARDSRFEIHVWKWRRKRTTFRAFHRHPIMPPAIAGHQEHRVDDEERDPVGIVSTTTLSVVALLLSPAPRGPDFTPSIIAALPTVRPHGALAALDPFAPRPPPLSTPL